MTDSDVTDPDMPAMGYDSVKFVTSFYSRKRFFATLKYDILYSQLLLSLTTKQIRIFEILITAPSPNLNNSHQHEDKDKDKRKILDIHPKISIVITIVIELIDDDCKI